MAKIGIQKINVVRGREPGWAPRAEGECKSTERCKDALGNVHTVRFLLSATAIWFSFVMGYIIIFTVGKRNGVNIKEAFWNKNMCNIQDMIAEYTHSFHLIFNFQCLSVNAYESHKQSNRLPFSSSCCLRIDHLRTFFHLREIYSTQITRYSVLSLSRLIYTVHKTNNESSV